MSSATPSGQVGAVRGGPPKRRLAWLWWLLALLLALIAAAIIIAAIHHHRSHHHSTAPAVSSTPTASPTTIPTTGSTTSTPSTGALPSSALIGGGAHEPSKISHPARGRDGTVLFRPDGTAVNAAGRSVIDEAVKLIASEHSQHVTVTGYTDIVAGERLNTRLAGRRARVVAAELRHALGAGVTVTTRSRGQHDPVKSNRTEAGRAQNRRAVITGS